MGRTLADIDAARRAGILAGKPPAPKNECNYCGYHVPPRALWCSTGCAQEFEKEKRELAR